tara:strand:- start:9130 stop:9711 length:582 start_codon:yes stop_codon:yes gene_type:complete
MRSDNAEEISQITGLILAGGAGRRVGHRDKGLLPWAGKPLIAHVCSRIRPQVSALIISCNRNRATYLKYASTTVTDGRTDFQGPLAGIEAALPEIETEYLLVVTCDMPQLPKDLASRLRGTMLANPALDACYAHDGERAQYLCTLIRHASLQTLPAFLDAGERAVHRWYLAKQVAEVDFSDCREAFRNLNEGD